MLRSSFRRAVVLGFCFSCCCFAQRDLGTVTGVVTDSTGAVVPAARLPISEAATGQKYTVEADSSGTYVRPLLKPGTYTVEVVAAGFQRAIQKRVLVPAGDRIGVNIQLTVGEMTQSLEVTAVAPMLQTESTIVGQTLEASTLSELPLGGQRVFSFLARLSPGVLPGESGSRDSAGGSFSANGVRSNGQNNYLLNGIDNNVNVIDFLNATAFVVGPSMEAIAEMKVLTNGYNAEYGRGAGGVVNVTIKSGTNQIHGTLVEFLQNDKLNANTWAGDKAGKPKGSYRQNQFGAAVGGPVIKNRTFWFMDYQGTRIRSGNIPYTGTVPVTQMKNGDFSSILGTGLGTDALGTVVQGEIFDINTTRQLANGTWVRDPFPGNIIPASRFDPAAKKMVDLFPAPNQNLGTRLPGNNYFTNTSQQSNNDQGDIRIDQRLTDKDSLFGTFSWGETQRNT